MARTDYYLLNDPELSFKEVVKMSLVDDPASFLRERFAESFKSEFRALEEKVASHDAAAKSAATVAEPEKKIKEEEVVDKEVAKVEEQVESEAQETVKPDEDVKMEVDAKKEDEEPEKMETEEEVKEKKEVEQEEQQTVAAAAEPIKTEDDKPIEAETEPVAAVVVEAAAAAAASEGEVTKETADSQVDLNETAKIEEKDGDVEQAAVVDGTATAVETTETPQDDGDGSDDETPLDIVAAKQSKDKKDEGVKKSVDESIYDFEDSVEPKPSLTHERTRRRSNSETEGDDKEESDEELPAKEIKDDLYKDTKIDTSKVRIHAIFFLSIFNMYYFVFCRL